MLNLSGMKPEEGLKGQLKHLLFHFGVQFEDPYFETHSVTDDVIEELLSEEEICSASIQTRSDET